LPRDWSDNVFAQLLIERVSSIHSSLDGIDLPLLTKGGDRDMEGVSRVLAAALVFSQLMQGRTNAGMQAVCLPNGQTRRRSF
jgi:hypothetical protein